MKSNNRSPHPIEILVSDLRQYVYCPRIVYYHYCLPAIRPLTFNMEAGTAAHQAETDREHRRSLRVYHLKNGERYFDMFLESPELGLRGKVDMVIQRDSEVIPVEYKNSPGRTGKHILLQLTAYGMLLEEVFQLPAQRGFIYYIPARRSREIVLDRPLRQEVLKTIVEIQAMVMREQMPAPPRRRNECEICEFRRFCNDVT